jgi:hypothetical protein
VTKQEYDVLTQHDARLASLEDKTSDIRAQIAALPGLLSDLICDKVEESVKACRAESEQRRDMVDQLWAERQRRAGVTRFWVATGKVATVLAAVAGATYGLLQLL